MSTQDIREKTTLPSNGVGQQSWVSRPLTINDWAIYTAGAGQVIPQFSDTALSGWTLTTDGGLGKSFGTFSTYIRPLSWVANGAYLVIASVWYDANPGMPTSLRILNNGGIVAFAEGDGSTSGRTPQCVSALIPWTGGAAVWCQVNSMHNNLGGQTITTGRIQIIKLS